MDPDQFKQWLEVFAKSQELLIQSINSGSRVSTSSTSSSGPASIASALIPNFENFVQSKESFKMYRQRFENYLTMKGVFQDKTLCSQLLLNSVGSANYQLIVSLVAPKSPSEYTYNELISKIENHLCPKKNVLVAQHQFLTIYQQENQSIAEYAAALRRDIGDCEFISPCKCKANLADMFLRIQFIRGIYDSSMREQILQTAKDTFEDIIQQALAIEASKLDSRSLMKKTSTPN